MLSRRKIKYFLTLEAVLCYFWGVVGKSGKKCQRSIKLLFRGQFTYSVDAKGRISIPAKFRKHVSPECNDTFVMTQGTVKCIEIYPLDQWVKQEEKLLNLNTFNPEHARFIRMHLQNAFEDNLDNQSRILIPQNLLTYAGIEKDVLILGVLKKIELWNPAIYNDYINSSDKTYEEIAAKVMVG
jgi:MraZ protein